uniref:uncharacterized protein LOC120823834 isoform X4 n=1 Tax=Gasterosteus aculeatus aculeatus TaxID=481459 RepID=UPI001A990E1C|nr:uncharacterized protein LOC120823834 isoform X4 [Gasterosteus aculeatus aculeatus]
MFPCSCSLGTMSLCFHCSMFLGYYVLLSYVPSLLCSLGPMFPGYYVHWVLCSMRTMFTGSYVSSVLCSLGTMFPGQYVVLCLSYVPSVLCSLGTMLYYVCPTFPESSYVPWVLSSLCTMFPGSYVVLCWSYFPFVLCSLGPMLYYVGPTFPLYYVPWVLCCTMLVLLSLCTMFTGSYVVLCWSYFPSVLCSLGPMLYYVGPTFPLYYVPWVLCCTMLVLLSLCTMFTGSYVVLCWSYVPSVLCSLGTMFPLYYVPWVLCSLCTMFRWSYVFIVLFSWVLCSQCRVFLGICFKGPMLLGPYGPIIPCSQCPMFPLCSQNPTFLVPCVHKVLCSHRSMFLCMFTISCVSKRFPGRSHCPAAA